MLRFTLLSSDAVWVGAVAIVSLVAGTCYNQLSSASALGGGAAIIAPGGSVQESGTKTIERIGSEEVARLLSAPGQIAIDARPRVFFDLGHLPGAWSLSREQFDQDFRGLEANLRNSENTYIVYCSDLDCEDGAVVARELQKRGLPSVRLFAGGIAEWEAAGFQLQRTP